MITHTQISHCPSEHNKTILEYWNLLILFMINQVEQSSNQYGFYAVPKALEPKKKYR